MKSTGNKGKNRQVRLYQTKKLLYRKGNNKMKGQPMEWEKIFANHIFDKSLLYKIHKKILHSVAKKQITLF